MTKENKDLSKYLAKQKETTTQKLERRKTEGEVLAKRQDEIKKSKWFDLVNPMATDLVTSEVKENTVDAYHRQIAHNFMIGTKAYFFIARDLVSAEQKLVTSDFNQLKDRLKEVLSRATVDKLIQIGKSDRILELYNQQLLPLQWTTQYKLTVLPDDQYDQVKDEIYPEITQKEINQHLGVETNKESEFDIENSKVFLKIAVDKKTADPNKMRKIFNLVKSIISDVNDEHVIYTTKNKLDFKAEASFDENYFDTVYEDTSKHIETIKVKEQSKKFMDAFKNYFSQKLVA